MFFRTGPPLLSVFGDHWADMGPFVQVHLQYGSAVLRKKAWQQKLSKWLCGPGMGFGSRARITFVGRSAIQGITDCTVNTSILRHEDSVFPSDS